MKRLLFLASLCSFGLALPLTPAADPLPAGKVPADVKWVLHLDADKFRATRVGDYFFREFLDRKSAKGKEDLKQWLDFDLDWAQVHSITAFGPTYQPKADKSGLLLVHTSMEVVRGLETAIARNNPTLRLEKLEAGANPLYQINKDSFLWAGPDGWFLLGKSRAALDQARAVFTGGASNLTGAGLLQGYGPATDSFFFIGLGDDFGQKADLPPNAAILKQADGGRLVIGERGTALFANLAIRTKTPEVAQQIQQIIQGLIALGTLSQDQKPELQELAQGAKVTAAEKLVTIGVEVPVARALEKIAERK